RDRLHRSARAHARAPEATLSLDARLAAGAAQAPARLFHAAARAAPLHRLVVPRRRIPGAAGAAHRGAADLHSERTILRSAGAHAVLVAAADRAGMRRGSLLRRDRKSTRLNSSHSQISYAVFCL